MSVSLQRPPLRLRLLLCCGTLLYFFMNFQRAVVPGPLFNELQAALQAPASSITALSSSFMYVYAFCHLITGLMADRYGGFRVLKVCGFIFCLGSLLFPYSRSLATMFTCRFLIGLGASGIYLSLVKEISRLYPNTLAGILGVVIFIGYIGCIAANSPFQALTHYLSWQTGLKLVAMASFGVLAVTIALLRGIPQTKNPDVPLNLSPFVQLLHNSHNRKVLTFFSLTFSIYFVMQTILGKKFLQDFYGMSPVAAGWILTLMSVLATLANLFTPGLRAHFGHRSRFIIRWAGALCIISVVSLSISVCYNIRNAAFGGCLLTMSLAAGISPIIAVVFRDTNPPQLFSTIISFLNFLCFFLVALMGNLLGFLMDQWAPKRQGELLIYGRSSYLAVLIVLILLAIIALWHCLHIREPLADDGKADGATH